jgi:hypothetical protein
MAKIIKKRQSGWLALEWVGAVLLFFFPVGSVIGLILLICGENFGERLICSQCCNKIDSKEVRICPTCKANIEQGNTKDT